LSGLFYICDYFGITPQEFFDTDSLYPTQLKDFVEDVTQLDENKLLHLANFMKEIVGNRK